MLLVFFFLIKGNSTVSTKVWKVTVQVVPLQRTDKTLALTEVKTEQVSCHMKTSHTPVCSSASLGLEACLANIGFKALPIPPHKPGDKDRRGLVVGAKYKQEKNAKRGERLFLCLFSSLSLHLHPSLSLFLCLIHNSLSIYGL